MQEPKKLVPPVPPVIGIDSDVVTDNPVVDVNAIDVVDAEVVEPIVQEENKYKALQTRKENAFTGSYNQKNK